MVKKDIKEYIAKHGRRKTDSMIAREFDTTKTRVRYIRRVLGIKRNMPALYKAHKAGTIDAGRGSDIVQRKRKDTALETAIEREDRLARVFARKLARVDGVV